MEEIKINQIKGYENVRDCYIIRSDGKCINIKTGKILKYKINKSYRYPHYTLLCKDNKFKNIGIHRILAQAFIPNPNNYPIVRHLNDNKNDWRLENLAWGTASDNTQDIYNNTGGYTGIGNKCKLVKCIETDIIYRSVQEAERQTGINHRHISGCCLGRYGHKTAGGYHWKYVEEV